MSPWIGNGVPPEIRRKISQSLKGRPPNAGSYKKGHVPWVKGKKHPQTVKDKISFTKTGVLLSEEERKKRRSWSKNKRNRVKKRFDGDATHSFGDWQLLKRQYGFRCPSCNVKEPEITLTEDHIVPLSRGGTDAIENIQPLCLKCNLRKHTKIIRY